MILILWLLGILIVALTVRQLLRRAPKNGKPFLLRFVVIVVLIIAAALAMRGLWPIAMSLLGGLVVYGRPVLQAFGLWRQLQAMQKTNPPHKPLAAPWTWPPHGRYWNLQQALIKQTSSPPIKA